MSETTELMPIEPDSLKLAHSVTVEFQRCNGAPGLQQVKWLAHQLAQEGFHPSPSVANQEIIAAEDVDALVEDRYEDYESKQQIMGGLLRSVSFQLLLSDLSKDTWCSFGWMVFKGEYVQVTLGGSVYATKGARRDRQPPFAEALLTMAKKMYLFVQPTYGFIEDPDVGGHPPGDKSSRRHQIVTLSWVNFFGPDYVAKYGRELLANIPGHHTEDLSDGGLLYQSRANIVPEDELAHRRWQREAQQYLAAHGITIRFGYGYG